jgi:hypothetical protein
METAMTELPGHWMAPAAVKAAPAIATSTVLILARVWNAHGAEHSVGDAFLMGTLATAAAISGGLAAIGRTGDAVTGTAYATAGTLAMSGVAAYSNGLPLPLLLWAIATLTAYVLAARTWRQDRRTAVAFEQHMTDRREEHAHVERVEAIRARAQIDTARVQIEVARESTAYATALAEAIAARAALPGFDPADLIGEGTRELPPVTRQEGH